MGWVPMGLAPSCRLGPGHISITFLGPVGQLGFTLLMMMVGARKQTQLYKYSLNLCLHHTCPPPMVRENPHGQAQHE